MLQPVVRRGLLGSASNALASSAPSAAAAAAATKAAGVRARARPWEALQRGQQPWRGMAVETSEPTPVPPPPPAPRNYVYPAVLALTAATVAYVMMTPDDDAIDAKIMEAVKARMPPAGGEDGGEVATAPGGAAAGAAGGGGKKK